MVPAQWPPAEGQNPMLDEFNAELCLESCCCLGCAVGSTRELMKYKFAVNDSDCDIATICCTICCFFSARRHARHLAAKMLMGCMTAQQAVELQIEENKRAQMGAYGSAPPQQTMG